MEKSFDYYLLFKPYDVLSQFTKEHEKHSTLADLELGLPDDVYPVGRLDRDSEGLLFLTNDKALNHHLLSQKVPHKRTYWVQVEGQITDEALRELEQGVNIRVNKKEYTTRPAEVERLPDNPLVPEREPPIHPRQGKGTTWIALSITDGKNRQVRRMTAKVGYPTLRLIRRKIVDLSIRGMATGDLKKLDTDTVYQAIGVDFEALQARRERGKKSKRGRWKGKKKR